MKTKKTTRAHYDKYKQLASLLGVTLKHNPDLFGSVEKLRAAYESGDVHFNRATSLIQFDALYFHIRRAAQEKGITSYSMSENVCLYKHLLFYEVLQLVPEFTD